MRFSDWSSDVCSSDLQSLHFFLPDQGRRARALCHARLRDGGARAGFRFGRAPQRKLEIAAVAHHHFSVALTCRDRGLAYRHGRDRRGGASRSEEHTSELRSLIRISYAVFYLKKTKTNVQNIGS